MKKEMKKEMKNWNGTIELRPHWSSHTHVCRCVADASQRAHSISFQGIHLYMVYMVYTGAEIAARAPPSEHLYMVCPKCQPVELSDPAKRQAPSTVF